MMTLEGFERYIQTEVEKGIPFIAYHYSGGCGLMRTGPIEQEPKAVYHLYYNRKRLETYRDPDTARQAARREWRVSRIRVRIEKEYIQPKPVQAKKSSISAFRREIARLAKRVNVLCVAEFDGTNLVVTGGLEK